MPFIPFSSIMAPISQNLHGDKRKRNKTNSDQTESNRIIFCLLWLQMHKLKCHAAAWYYLTVGNELLRKCWHFFWAIPLIIILFLVECVYVLFVGFLCRLAVTVYSQPKQPIPARAHFAVGMRLTYYWYNAVLGRFLAVAFYPLIRLNFLRWLRIRQVRTTKMVWMSHQNITTKK